LSVTLQDSTVIVARLTACTDFHCTKNILLSERPDCYEWKGEAVLFTGVVKLVPCPARCMWIWTHKFYFILASEVITKGISNSHVCGIKTLCLTGIAGQTYLAQTRNSKKHVTEVMCDLWEIHHS